MEVIKDGKFGKPENWKAQIDCSKKDDHDSGGCGAELEITAEDLILMYWKSPLHNKYYSAVKCPQCGKINSVGDIPGPIFEKLNTEDNRKNATFDGFSDSPL